MSRTRQVQGRDVNGRILVMDGSLANLAAMMLATVSTVPDNGTTALECPYCHHPEVRTTPGGGAGPRWPAGTRAADREGPRGPVTPVETVTALMAPSHVGPLSAARAPSVVRDGSAGQRPGRAGEWASWPCPR
jgi:hypothetical protein